VAAVNTKRIHIGTGVAIPGTRIAPVTAHSIASINQLAPGRVFLGIGTGHTAIRVMGQEPMPLKQFREFRSVRPYIPRRNSCGIWSGLPLRRSRNLNRSRRESGRLRGRLVEVGQSASHQGSLPAQRATGKFDRPAHVGVLGGYPDRARPRRIRWRRDCAEQRWIGRRRF
jgi:hypothetical protein